MRLEPGDTSAAAERVLVEGYRRMTPEQRLGRVMSLNASLRELAAARIRATYGRDIPPRELRLRLAALRLERNLMIRAFAWDPEIEGF